MLVWPAAVTGVSLILNEIDPERAASLAELFPHATLSGHDAELIDDHLAPGLSPTLVAMNPPFARSAGRGEDRHAAARHLAAALARLQSGGRLVAIMPESFSPSGTGRNLRARLERGCTLRLDCLVEPGAFARHGTGVAVRFLVYDKARDEADPAKLETGCLQDLLAAVQALPPRREASSPCAAPGKPAPSLFTRSRVPSSAIVAPLARTSGTSAAPLAYAVLDQPAAVGDGAGLYLPYRPSRVTITGAAAHPTPLVESLPWGRSRRRGRTTHRFCRQACRRRACSPRRSSRR
jgi:hypothetical protein